MFAGREDIDAFLRDYWQKRPLLLRQALPDFRDPLSPEELAGLACEEEVESRLVFTRGTVDAPAWDMRPGPFAERDFTSLPESGWTLLVQAVDHWLPEVRALLCEVSFLPSWRLDDIMVSYAAPGGGVGPHFDYYDVFLLQGQGTRTWRLGDTCDAATPLLASSGLKILEHFNAQEEYTLHAGDVLYIPPGIAHYGLSRDGSLCYSIGFRAPSQEEILLGFAAQAAAALPPDSRYADSGSRPGRRGEIPPASLDTLLALLEDALREPRPALGEWFGRRMTEPRYPELFAGPDVPLDAQGFAALADSGAPLARHALSRLAFLEQEAGLLLFADGEAFAVEPDAQGRQLVQMLCEAEEGEVLDLRSFLIRPACLRVLAALFNQGSLLELEDDEER